MSIGSIQGTLVPASQSKTEYASKQVEGSAQSTIAKESKEKDKTDLMGNENIASILSIKEKMQVDPGYVPNLQDKKLIESIERTNAELVGANRELQISIHEKTQRIVAKIVNKDTKEIIKEIPSEKLLDIVYSMLEYSGLVVDEKR